MRQTSDQESSLVRDDRGAIVVVSLLMATFLIGTCWYVFGIGNAIQYRENLQNAADASAFAAAVFNARGMNVLALINLLMTAVMMVLVAVRLVQAINFIVNIVSCIFGAFLDPLCDITTGFEAPIADAADSVGTVVVTAVKVMHYTEGFLAIVWPWMSEGKSMEASIPYQPGAVVGTTWATAMVPMSLNSPGDYASLLPGSVNFANVFSGEGSALMNPFSGQGADGWFHGRYGLPVQNDTINNLCSMSGEYVVDVVSLFVDAIGLGLISGPINDVVGGLSDVVAYVTGLVPEFFCNDDSGAIMAAVNALRSGGGGGSKDEDPNGSKGKSLGQQCSDEQKGTMSQAQKKCPTGSPKTGCGPGADGKPPTGCASICGLSAAAAGSYGAGVFKECVKAKGGGNTGTTQGDLVTKILYGNMGDDNFAVWSTAVGNWTEIADRGVAVGGLFGKSHPLVGPPPSDVLSGVAKAEFYYEPRTDSGSKEAQVEVQDVGGPSIPGLGAALIASDKNCMWNLRWRARLRRYRHPAPAFAFALGSGIEGLLTSTITDVSGGLGGAGGGAGGTAITDVVNPLANAYSGIANLPWPADPGTTTNPDAPAPGIYH